MYVLARRTGESLALLDGIIEVKVLSVTGKIVRIGISAPKEVSVERMEVHLQDRGEDHESET